MQEECAAEVAEMHIFIRRYMIRGDWRQIYPSRRILHNPLHQNWEKKREQWAHRVSLFIKLLKREEESGQDMNALDGLHHSGRLPFSPGFRRHAAVNERSDGGDKKHGGGFSTVACMQSHPLRVNGVEVTQRTTEDSGCLPSRHSSTPQLSPNLTHDVGIQLPLVCRWPAFYLLTYSWFPHILLAICEHRDRGDYPLSGTVPATASHVCLGWMQRAPRASRMALVSRLRDAAARVGCRCWRAWKLKRLGASRASCLMLS